MPDARCQIPPSQVQAQTVLLCALGLSQPVPRPHRTQHRAHRAPRARLRPPLPSKPTIHSTLHRYVTHTQLPRTTRRLRWSARPWSGVWRSPHTTPCRSRPPPPATRRGTAKSSAERRTTSAQAATVVSCGAARTALRLTAIILLSSSSVMDSPRPPSRVRSVSCMGRRTKACCTRLQASCWLLTSSRQATAVSSTGRLESTCAHAPTGVPAAYRLDPASPFWVEGPEGAQQCVVVFPKETGFVLNQKVYHYKLKILHGNEACRLLLRVQRRKLI
jgi:hypothetical protein